MSFGELGSCLLCGASGAAIDLHHKCPITVKISMCEVPSQLINGESLTTFVALKLYDAGVPLNRNQPDITQGSIQIYDDLEKDERVFIWRWKRDA